MTRLHYVKKARKAIKGTDIKKGDSYYWWQFAFRSKQVSKTMPRRSQYVTRSEHLGAIYDLEDQLSEMETDDIQDGCLDNIISEIENIRDICQERLDNMPEQLQEAPSGQTLQEYIDNLESWQSDLEGIDLDIDEDEIKEVAGEEYNQALNDYDISAKEDEEAEEPKESEEEIFDRLLENRKQEILDDIRGCNYPG